MLINYMKLHKLYTTPQIQDLIFVLLLMFDSALVYNKAKQYILQVAPVLPMFSKVVSQQNSTGSYQALKLLKLRQ